MLMFEKIEKIHVEKIRAEVTIWVNSCDRILNCNNFVALILF